MRNNSVGPLDHSTPCRLRNQRGLGFWEVLVAIALSTVAFTLVANVLSFLGSSQNKARIFELNSTVRENLFTILSNPLAWESIIANSSGALSCMSYSGGALPGSDCSILGGGGNATFFL